MAEAYILSACRTPIGKFGGELRSLSAPELGAAVVQQAVARAGIDPQRVEEVILGEVLTAGVGQAPARQAALKAGLPPRVAALTINKVCGSGLKAIALASQAVRCGDFEIVVAGGMESMSRAGYVLERNGPPLGDRRLIDTLEHDGLTCASSRRPMGDIAESVASAHCISRLDQDRFALESHRRAVRAIAENRFQKEIVPVPVRRKSEIVCITTDEGPRRDTSLEKLGQLPTVFRPEGGTVTAGNASMISDGAAAVVVASEAVAFQSDVRPLARIVATATSGGPPEELFTAPVEAIRTVLHRAKFSLDDIDLFELNEAFAVQMLACIRQLELPPERVNVHGGAIAMGHPIGASGARVLVTLLHALEQRQQRLGVAALCLGGGNAVAMLVERA